MTADGPTARAASALFTGTSISPDTGSLLKATAEFDVVSGTTLKVTLSNIGGDVVAPADILTAVFFTAAGVSAGSLIPVSAIIAAGSTVEFPGASDILPVGGNVGGEWAYVGGVPSTSAHTGNQGIGSAGFDHFGSANFGGPNLDGPDAVDGMQYGLISLSDNPATGNSPVTGAQPFIKHSVVFLLSGLPNGFDPSTDISNVTFQYGTSFTEPSLNSDPEPVVPEPGSVTLFAIGMACCSGYALRRRRQKAAII